MQHHRSSQSDNGLMLVGANSIAYLHTVVQHNTYTHVEHKFKAAANATIAQQNANTDQSHNREIERHFIDNTLDSARSAAHKSLLCTALYCS
jgi:hypothetical protein